MTFFRLRESFPSSPVPPSRRRSMFLTEVEIEDDKHYRQSADEASKQSNIVYNEEMQAQFDEVLDNLLTLANKDNSEANDNLQSEECPLNNEEDALLSEHEADSDLQNDNTLCDKGESTIILLEKKDDTLENNDDQNDKYEENIFITESVPLVCNKSKNSNDEYISSVNEEKKPIIVNEEEENEENEEMTESYYPRKEENNVELNEGSPIIIIERQDDSGLNEGVQVLEDQLEESNRENKEGPVFIFEKKEDCKDDSNPHEIETDKVTAYELEGNESNAGFEIEQGNVVIIEKKQDEDTANDNNTETNQMQINECEENENKIEIVFEQVPVVIIEENKSKGSDYDSNTETNQIPSNDQTENEDSADFEVEEKEGYKEDNNEYNTEKDQMTVNDLEENETIEFTEVAEVPVLFIEENLEDNTEKTDEKENNENADLGVEEGPLIVMQEKCEDQPDNKENCNIEQNNNDNEESEVDNEFEESYQSSSPDGLTIIIEEKEDEQECEKQNDYQEEEANEEEPNTMMIIEDKDNYGKQSEETNINVIDNVETTAKENPIIFVQGKENTEEGIEGQAVIVTFPENNSAFLTKRQVVDNESEDFDPDSLEENNFENSSLLLVQNKEDDELDDNVFLEEDTMPTLRINTRNNDKHINRIDCEKDSLDITDEITNIVDATDKEALLTVPHNSFCINNEPIDDEYSDTENSFEYEPYVPLKKVDLTTEEHLRYNNTRSKVYSEDQESDERSMSFVYIPVVDNDIEEDIRKQMLNEADRTQDDELETVMHAKRFETRKLSSDILEAVESFLDTKIDLEKALERDMAQDEGPYVDSNGVKLRRKPRTSSNISLSRDDMQKVKNRLSGAGNEEAVARFVQDLIEEEMKKASSPNRRDSTDKKQHSPELDEEEQMIAEVVQALIREEMELEKEIELLELCRINKVNTQLYEEFKNVILFALFLFVILIIVN